MSALATDAGASPPLDHEAILDGLKPFQRATVDHVFRRLWTDEDCVDRFLVADEVGLGKTLVAKGVAARAICHLRATANRQVTIVYICSNSQIASQNLDRLRELTGGESRQSADRITMLPQTMGTSSPDGVQLLALTPGTSLRLGDATGRVGERVLLHWMLSQAFDWPELEEDHVIDYFRDGVGFDRFADRLEWDSSRPELDSPLVDAFAHEMDEAKGPFGGTLLDDLVDELELWRSNGEMTDEMKWRRRRMIGELRMAMARTAVDHLSPDLVILDEFQRFKDLFPGARAAEDPHISEAQKLAQKLITHPGAKSLVLSATPYKMFTLPDEVDGDDHQRDFHDTISFLAGPDRAASVREHFAEVRRGMLEGTEEGRRLAESATRQVEAELRRVMSRTERLGSGSATDMLIEKQMPGMELRPHDLATWRAADQIGRYAHGMDMFEFWRSCPYPVNLMDGSSYLSQRRTLELARDGDEGIAHLLRTEKVGLLPWSDIQKFKEIDPGNPKLRAMTADVMEKGIWKLAWIAPSLAYTSPGGAFAEESARSFTKRLVFSAWSVVPKAICALLSYDAERRLHGAVSRAGGKAPARYGSPRAKSVLRFETKKGRLQNLAHLALLYPSVALARLGDPLVIAREESWDLPVDPDRLMKVVARRIQKRLDDLDLPIEQTKGQTAGWYGVAPYLLDAALGLEGLDLRSTLDGTNGDDPADSRYGEHVDFAVDPDWAQLGAPPEDLAEVLALAAVAAPGVCALRAVGRATGGADSYADDIVRAAAFTIGEGLRTMFNKPEIMAAVRAATPDLGSEASHPYWRLVLQYCLDGNAQSMLDEYVHSLVDSLGLRSADQAHRAAELAARISATASVRTAVNEVQELRVRAGRIKLETRKITSHIAARYGRSLSSEGAEHREATVRDSFNSPFWPFVLASTSVGQEGLDFHTYSHAVVHWNLPGNPVDMEQREGRVHRYKGHAIRRNVAEHHAHAALTASCEDPWTAMFLAAEEAEPEGSDGLSPYWICSGASKIERYVPAMPFSRESAQYLRLQRTLGAYRSVMGQPRQDDLIKLMGVDSEWPTVDLRPPRSANSPGDGQKPR